MNPDKKLSPKTYEIIDGDEYPSFIPAEESPPELTGKAIIIGILIGVVFGAANAYLGLKVGLTVSASIPAAVMAVAVFRIFFREGTILETNIVQTIGSAGESLAAGVIFTIPALFIWGMEPSKLDISIMAILGGTLGVLFMIPLRRYLIVKEHGRLPYPEGTACAEVLVAGQGDLSKAGVLFQGMGISAIYQALMHSRLFGLWNKEPATMIPGFRGAEVSAEVTPELLGVGYIIGPKISAIMLSGGMVGWLVMIPLIFLFGDHLTTPVYPESSMLIKDMEPGLIWSRYIRYIGAGGVAFAGIFSLIKSIPVILQSFRMGLSQIGKGTVIEKRTQQDLSLKTVGLGSIGLIVAIALFLIADLFSAQPFAGAVAAILIVIFGFFFVTVSSRIVGLLGSSSNPISGMTIATLLLTCVLFLLLGLGDMPNVKLCILTVGAIVCIAAAIAGDTSQDLKTGMLVGATPKYQQIGEIAGVVTAGLTMGYVMYLLKDAIVTGELPAPQANLMKLVIDGVIGGNLPWNLVFCGVFMAIGVELMGINSLAFAVGLYLPLSLSVPIMVGGAIRWVLERRSTDPDLEIKRENGVLYSSGLIAGAALTGVVILFLAGLAPDFLARVNRPGLHFRPLPGETFAVNGNTPANNYFAVFPRDFPDVAAVTTRISQLQKQIAATATSTDENQSEQQTLTRQLQQARAELQAQQSKSLTITCKTASAELSKQLTLTEWDKLYVSVRDDQIVIAEAPQWFTQLGVLAFSLLTLSLVLVTFRAPAKNNPAENGETTASCES